MPTVIYNILIDDDIHLYLQVKSAEASAKVTPDYKVCLERLCTSIISLSVLEMSNI